MIFPDQFYTHHIVELSIAECVVGRGFIAHLVLLAVDHHISFLLVLLLDHLTIDIDWLLRTRSFWLLVLLVLFHLDRGALQGLNVAMILKLHRMRLSKVRNTH